MASHIRDAMEYFFDADKPHWTAWCRVQKIDGRWLRFTPARSQGAPPLYYASLGGFYDLAEHLVGKHPEHINASGGQMGTPLVAAMGRKHFEVAELLYQNGENVDIPDDYKDTPLVEACKAGSLDTVQWLLNHRADVNTRGRAPLHSTVSNGHSQVCRMLLERNADIHIWTDHGETLLRFVANPYTGIHVNVDVMQALLDHGADPNAQDNSNSTPLHHSSWRTRRCNRGTVEGTRVGSAATVRRHSRIGHLQKRHFHIWIYMHAPGTKDVIGLVSHIWSVNNHEQLYMD